MTSIGSCRIRAGAIRNSGRSSGDQILRTHPSVSEAGLDQARKYNFERYHYQGIGRYEPDGVYARGIADLQVLANLVPQSAFLFGAQPSSIDAAIYGFIANIHFYAIDTPLKKFVASQPNLVRHCEALHVAMT
jgi:glutathione S-transferase